MKLLLCAVSLQMAVVSAADKQDSSLIASFCNPSSSISLKYLRSLISGALVGAGTGIVSAYFDTIAPHFWPVTWFAAMNIRCDILSSMEKDLADQEVPFHDGLLRLSSFAAAWIAWYKTYYQLNGAAPFVKN